MQQQQQRGNKEPFNRNRLKLKTAHSWRLCAIFFLNNKTQTGSDDDDDEGDCVQLPQLGVNLAPAEKM